MVRLCHVRLPVGRNPHKEHRLYSLSEFSNKVLEEANDNGDGPVEGVEAPEELEGLLRFVAGRPESSACMMLLLSKGVSIFTYSLLL